MCGLQLIRLIIYFCYTGHTTSDRQVQIRFRAAGGLPVRGAEGRCGHNGRGDDPPPPQPPHRTGHRLRQPYQEEGRTALHIQLQQGETRGRALLK